MVFRVTGCEFQNLVSRMQPPVNPGQLGGYSQRVMQQGVMSKVGEQVGDNMLLQYVLSLIAITLLGVFTNKMTEWTTFIQTQIKKWFNWEEPIPTLKFVVIQSKGRNTISTATTAILAWYVHIYSVIITK